MGNTGRKYSLNYTLGDFICGTADMAGQENEF